MNIREKSPGFLIDEYITAGFKLKSMPNNPEVRTRVAKLFDVINPYLHKISDDLVEELHATSKKCWDAQDIVMNISKEEGWEHDDIIIELALAAVKAQQYNAKRNKLIREIDKELDFNETVLEKTYGEE
jgi:hypothetical protein